MSGIVSVDSFSACALFDPGATHSFISTYFVLEHGIQSVPLGVSLSISTPIGGVLLTYRISCLCPVWILDREFFADLIILSMHDFDVILSMDWLSTYSQPSIVERSKRLPVRLVSALQIQKPIKSGYTAYLAAVVEASGCELRLDEIQVVRDFPDVFPKDLPGLPPDREVEFVVDLAPDTVPISRAPYRMGQTAYLPAFLL
ncbi:uncharacterized protein LOC143888926 [Tasmannia lanceolata]|uniref:uncharacterized protein LOC143888926 n=1 Tax=Tasmannia lanceolata TaxID=3420 RepID=UPI004063F536